MASAGVELQVLSATPASPHFEREPDAVAAARWVNDEYAELVRRFPHRFRAFASLPLPHVDAALAELDRALDGLGMVGAAVTTSVLGRSLADPSFAPLYAELDRRGAVLYVHPAGTGAESPLIAQHNLTWMIGAPIEDAVAAMHLILAGIPRAYPGIKIVISHLGGALPMGLERADHQYGWEAPGTSEKPSVAAGACGTTPSATTMFPPCGRRSTRSAPTGCCWAPTFPTRPTICSGRPSATSTGPASRPATPPPSSTATPPTCSAWPERSVRPM
jgi:predicted TIM-barrel fold metal-dependent hydrolase